MRERDHAIQVDHSTLRVPFASRTFFDSKKPHQKRFHSGSAARRVIYEFSGTRRGANAATSYETSGKITIAIKISIQSNVLPQYPVLRWIPGIQSTSCECKWDRHMFALRMSTMLLEYQGFIIRSSGYFQYRLTLWPKPILDSSKFSGSSWVAYCCFIVDRIDGKGKSVKISPSRVCALNA